MARIGYLATVGLLLALGAPAAAAPLLTPARELATATTCATFDPHPDAVAGKEAALRYAADPRAALDRIRDLENAHYRSLALGGIAASHVRTDPGRAADLLREAMEAAGGYAFWAEGREATSLTRLFGLIRAFPRRHATALVDHAWIQVARIQDPGRRGRALPALAQLTVEYRPETVEARIDELAQHLQANHFFGAFRIFGRHLARTRDAETRAFVDGCFAAARDMSRRGRVSPRCDRLAGPAVLGIAERDLEWALARTVVERRLVSPEGVLWPLGGLLREQGRMKELDRVLEVARAARDTGRLHGEAGIRMIAELERMRAGEPPALTETPVAELGPEDVDAFIVGGPATPMLRRHIRLGFRDRAQAQRLVETALARPPEKWGWCSPKWPHGLPAPLLALVAAWSGDAATARRLSAQIDEPKIRTAVALDVEWVLSSPTDEARAWHFDRPYVELEVRFGA